MKKLNKKGYFIIETIVVIALVSTIIAYILPNISKLYEDYKYKTQLFDQTEDIYLLKAIYNKNTTSFNTITGENDIYVYRRVGFKTYEQSIPPGAQNIDDKAKNRNDIINSHSISHDVQNIKVDTFVIGYNSHPKIYTPISEYADSPRNLGDNQTFTYDSNFNRYISRLKMKTYDNTSNRLVARIVRTSGGIKKTTYASIKIVANSLPNGYVKMPKISKKSDETFIETRINFSVGVFADKVDSHGRIVKITAWNADEEITIFGAQNNIGYDSDFYGAIIYTLKDGKQKEIHNFVPAKKTKNDGSCEAAGIYDMVESKFYTSSGEEEFDCN